MNCGIKDPNPEMPARREDYERFIEDEYEERNFLYEEALEQTTPDEVKLIARCLLRHRERAVAE